MREVFLTFLRLGLTSFGGPIAHLGYFRREFVERRHWLTDGAFTHVVAFCSVLPGPTSSQVGMIVGYLRGGAGGGFFAWLGFTAPSAILLACAAAALGTLEAGSGGATPGWLGGVLAGLSAAAAAVVAQAILAMAHSQCPDRETRTIAIGAMILALALQGAANLQWVPIAAGALVGALFLERRTARRTGPAAPPLPIAVAPGVAIAAAVAFAVVAALAAALAHRSGAASLLSTIVRAGSLVFGGGHVVLPLLSSVVENGLMPQRDFFAGYGAAQAVPGPLFAFAAFLGAANRSPLHGATGAAIATLAIFTPSFLLLFAVAPVWNRLIAFRATGRALRGANAGVVGLLAAVLYSPMIVSLGTSTFRLAIALAAFALIVVWRLSPWAVVLLAALTGAMGVRAGAAL